MHIRELAGSALDQLAPHDARTFLGSGPVNFVYDVDPFVLEDPRVSPWLLELLKEEIYKVDSYGEIDSDFWLYSFARDALILLAAFPDVACARENVRRYTDRAVVVWTAGHRGVLIKPSEQSVSLLEDAAQIQLQHQRRMFDTVLRCIERAVKESQDQEQLQLRLHYGCGASFPRSADRH